MFSELKGLVELIAASLKQFKDFRRAKEREGTVKDFLKLYFILSDVVADGEGFLSDVGSDPEEFLNQFKQEDMDAKLKHWGSFIRVQGERLYSVGGWIHDTPSLKIIDPLLTEKLDKLIGQKGRRVRSLSTIVSGLFISTRFPLKDREQQIELIKSMYRKKAGGMLDVKRSSEEIDQLKVSLESFRQLCLGFIEENEILRLSRQARDEYPGR